MIKRLYISKLFDSRDIDIKFPSDIGILVGRNGCGKTTVLNIISAIGMGRLAILSRYNFKEIVIEYLCNNKPRTVRIKKLNNDSLQVFHNENAERVIINEMNLIKHGVSVFDNEVLIDNNSKYASEISQEMNVLFLPLSRDINIFEKLLKLEMNQNFRTMYSFGEANTRPVSNIDETLELVDELVKESHRKMTFTASKLAQKMLIDIFSTFFIYSEVSAGVLHKEDKLKEDKIQELKKALGEIGVLTPEVSRAITDFVNRLRADATVYNKVFIKSTKPSDLTKESIESASKYFANSPISDRILRWIEIANNYNSQKNDIFRKYNNFIEIVNKFLKDSQKTIEYDNAKGTLVFNVPDIKGLPLSRLSSGEKQIVIFFAYLMFKINHDNKGTFIIDEPEISLHLEWQNRFSKSLLQAVPEWQFIFATHSPEIIGPFRDRCISLEV